MELKNTIALPLNGEYRDVYKLMAEIFGLSLIGCRVD